MMKLLFGRLMPAGVAAVILTSALSPLRPALDAFGAAAIALTGQEPEPVAGGATLGEGLIPQAPQPKAKEQKRKLQELATRMRDPNAPKLKDFQAPANARNEPRTPAPLRPERISAPRAPSPAPPGGSWRLPAAAPERSRFVHRAPSPRWNTAPPASSR